MVRINRLKRGSKNGEDDSDMAKWIADKRLYLSEDGQVVDEAAPGRKTLLAPAGSQVSDEVCRRHGLGPYAEQAEAAEDGGKPEPETVGSCCPHAYRVHRSDDGLCGQRRHCGCQGWQPLDADEAGNDGDSGKPE